MKKNLSVHNFHTRLNFSEFPDSRNGWLAIVIPNLDFVEAKKAAADLRLTLYDPICGDTYMVHRLLNTERDRTDAFQRLWSIDY
jgi:hypothetical protein